LFRDRLFILIKGGIMAFVIFIVYIIGCFFTLILSSITNKIVIDRKSQYFVKVDEVIGITLLSWAAALVLSIAASVIYVDKKLNNNDVFRNWLEGDK
jgi:flagellar biosynthesis component FlhA